MVDGLHIPTWNRTKKPLAIALSGAGRGWGGETNVIYIYIVGYNQCKV
jgi:hypothetical protein